MPRSLEVDGDNRRKRRVISLEQRIHLLLDGQWGVASRAQLQAIGVTRAALDHRVRDGRLEIVLRGTYALSRRLLPRQGWWLAAVLAVGADAALSHRSAAAHWAIGPTHGAPTDVTSPRRLAPRPGIVLHNLRYEPDEVVVHDGIPTTTPSRTLFDLAALLPLRRLERTLREADHRRLHGGPPLPELLARYPGRTGVPKVRALAAMGAREHVTRSDLEDRFLEVVACHGLPRPEVNALVEVGAERFEVDCLWRRARLVVELDGFAAHGTAAAFEADRRRDRLLGAAGFRVVRVTWRQLRDDETDLVRDIRASAGG